MESTLTAGDVLRKILFLTLFGFLALILAGPVIAVFSVVLSLILSLIAVLLPFFLFGLILWLPFQSLVLGQKVEWNKVGASAKALVGGLLGAFGRTFRGGVYAVRGVGRGVGRVAGFTSRLVGGTVLVAFSVLVAAVLGALAGGVLGVVGGMMHDDPDYRTPVGLAVGAGVGVIFGLARLTGRRTKVIVAEVVEPVRTMQAVHMPRMGHPGLKGCVEVPAK
jgi:hypothetical protein